jgi:glycosyltransferase involved in cell wall biosynthesis
VVSTNVGGIPDLIGDEPAALLVDAGDAQAMAEKVLLLIDHPEQARPLIAAGRRVAENYTWSHVREALFNVYFPAGTSGLLRARIERKQA